jgi:hypothetical protein
LLSYLQEHYGDVASVVGLVVSIGGFVATIIGVGKARKAAEDARQAAREAVSRIGARLVEDEVNVVFKLLTEADVCCGKSDWDACESKCLDARSCLIPLMRNPTLTEPEQSEVSAMIHGLRSVVKDVKRLRTPGNHSKTFDAVRNKLHGMVVALGPIMGRFQSRDFEVSDGG